MQILIYVITIFITRDQVKEHPPEETAQEDEVEVEPDEKTPLNTEDPKVLEPAYIPNTSTCAPWKEDILNITLWKQHILMYKTTPCNQHIILI